MTAEDQTNKPLVTVITPTYNRADLLAETIDSVLSQDYEAIEYLVLDDGSKDNTREVLSGYDDARISYFHHDNMGAIRTINRGFSLAQGEFVTVVNSDDPLLPDYLTEMVSFLQEHPEIIGAYPDWVMIDGQSQPVKQMQVKAYDFISSLRDYECYQGPGTMFRRRIFDLVEPYDDSFPTFFDYEFYMRVGMLENFMRLPKTLATYRRHGGSLTSQAGGKLGDEYIALMDKLYDLPEMPAEAQPIKKKVYSAAHYLTGMMALNDYRRATRHFMKSIAYCPLGCTPGGHGRAWNIMFYVMFLGILPQRVSKAIESLRRRNR